MVKFKVGDVVERCVDIPTFEKLVGHGPYVVTSMTRSGSWLQINGWVDLATAHPWCAGYFKLAAGQLDDPLPPAPESVRYNDEYPDRRTYKQTWLNVKQDNVQLYIETGQYGEDKGVGMVLSPDSALQLAHDLTRMAMEIKRKGKQNV